MKAYKVELEITPVRGQAYKTTELVYYPRLDPNHPSSCIPEREREYKGISQARASAPAGAKIRALSSISIGGHRMDLV